MVPDAPDTIDLSGGSSGPWPAFTISGSTGAAAVNTTYALQPFTGSYVFAAANTANISGGGGTWSIEGSNGTEYFSGTGEWPWTVATWTPSNGAGGTPAFVRALAAPDTIAQSGASSVTYASLTTALTGANNDLTFEALVGGRIGNDIRIRYVSPGTNNAALSVVVSDNGRDVTVNLATNGSAAITSTATQVADAVNLVGALNDLLAVANAAANNGTGVVTAMAWTHLSGGTGGTPLPPDTITL